MKASGCRHKLRELKSLSEWDRRRIFTRDNFTCQIPDCGRKVGLEVHHINGEFADLMTNDYNSAYNLITVCRDCHAGLTNMEINHLAVYLAFIQKPLLDITMCRQDILVEVPSE